jgi:ketosteroid isomerase-like protein
MKQWLVLAVAALLAFSAALGQTKGRKSAEGSVESVLMQMEREWGQAYLKADLAALDRIEAADYTYIDAQGTTGDKAQDLAETKSGVYKAQSISVDEMKVRVFGNTAVVTGRDTLKGAQYKGKDISGQYRFTDVFVQRDGRWQAVATHSSKIAAP